MGNNKVELLNWFGGDLLHAQDAWYSTGGETEKKKDRISELLKNLAAKGHTSPFEDGVLRFRVCAEYASHIHSLKHRIGVSINSESARYKEYQEDNFYIPKDWPKNLQNDLEEYCLRSFEKYHSTIVKLQSVGMDRGRAKETARFYLPLAKQLYFSIRFNFMSFVHFQKLRNSEHAQLEIREIAKEMLRLVKENTNGEFQHSLSAWRL